MKNTKVNGKETNLKFANSKVSIENIKQSFYSYDKDTNPNQIHIFRGQRDVIKRPKDAKGFISKIISYCISILSDSNQEVFNSILDNLNVNEINLSHDIDNVIRTSKSGAIYDGQHRTLWIISFINNEISIDIDGKEYLFKDLEKSLKDAFLNFKMELSVVNTDDYDVIMDLFHEYNSSHKNVTKTETIIGRFKREDRKSGDNYLKLKNDDGSLFCFSDVVDIIYNRNSTKQFVSSVSYVSGLITPKNTPVDNVLNSFLENYTGIEEGEFFESLKEIGKLHNILFENDKIYSLIQSKGHHVTRALLKILYENFSTGEDIVGINRISSENEILAKEFLAKNAEKIACIVPRFKDKTNETYQDFGRTERLKELILSALN